MCADIDKIRTKVHLTFFQDGLWDMFLGIFLLAWGLTVWFDLPLLPSAVFVLFFWLILGLKQTVTYPRTGYAKPAELRSRSVKTAIIGVIVLAAILILMPVVIQENMQFLRDNLEFMLNSGLAVAAAVVGYWWSIKRWYVYSVLIMLFLALYLLIGFSYQVSFLIPGSIILLTGFAILVGFLRQYRIFTGESVDEPK